MYSEDDFTPTIHSMTSPSSSTERTRPSPTTARPSRMTPRPYVATSRDSTPLCLSRVLPTYLGSTTPLPERTIPCHAKDRIEIHNLKRIVAKNDAVIAQLFATIYTLTLQRGHRAAPQLP